MSVIIAVAVYDTVENQRTEYTERTLNGLLDTVDFTNHHLFISDNGSCEETHALYKKLSSQFIEHGFPLRHLTIQYNGENIGTARAINEAIKIRKDKHVIKMDNDVIVHKTGWVDDLEEAVTRDPSIGICACKRFDLEERPDHEIDHYRSAIQMLPHERGQSWIVVEHVHNVMGTVTLLSSALLDKVGHMFQVGKYGLDDWDISVRSKLAGFKNCFLPYIKIEHLDRADNPFTQWKMDYAGTIWDESVKVVNEYQSGQRSIYYDGN